MRQSICPFAIALFAELSGTVHQQMLPPAAVVPAPVLAVLLPPPWPPKPKWKGGTAKGTWSTGRTTERAKTETTTRRGRGMTRVDTAQTRGTTTAAMRAGTTSRERTGTSEMPLRTVKVAEAPFGQCLVECVSGGGKGPSPGEPHPTATTERSSETTEPFYYEYEAQEELTQFGACNTSVVVDPVKRTVFHVLFYFCALWVPLWAVLSLVVNACFGQFGHNRWLDAFQELGFLLLFPFLGAGTLFPQLELLCLSTTVVLQFALVFILSVAFMQTHFASSLIKGRSTKNGSLPVAVYYIWPIAIATVPVVAYVLLLRQWYASTGVHCSVQVYSPLFWTVVVPAWTLWFALLVRNQLSITACKQSRPNVDREQLYWSRKSVKGVPILISWFLLTFFTALFALDMQLLWLAVAFALESLVLGPLLFVVHTYNHTQVNNGIFDRTELSVYRPCPLRRQPVTVPVVNAAAPTLPATTEPPQHKNAPATPPSAIGTGGPPSQSVPSVVVSSPPAAPVQQPSSVPSPLAAPVLGPATAQQQKVEEERGEASAQMFYEWLTDSNERTAGQSERVLWPPVRRP